MFFWYFIIGDSSAFDLKIWVEVVIPLIAQGKNPYQHTPFMNYPPLWMQFLFLIQRLNTITQISTQTLIRGLLILGELLVIVSTYGLLRKLSQSPKNSFRLTLWGIALNPLYALNTIQHGNIDVFVSFWIIIGVIFTLLFLKNKNISHHYCAAQALGIGILTKLIPVLLVPLLFIGFRQKTRSEKILVFLIFLIPICLGLSIVFTLNPDSLLIILGNRSITGYYGVTGILEILGISKFLKIYSPLFTLSLFSFLGWLCIVFQKHDVQEKTIIFSSALTLLLLPTLGPGYAPQYIIWYFPLLLVSSIFFKRKENTRLIILALALNVTYFIEYGFLTSHGAFMKTTDLITTQEFIWISSFLDTKTNQTILRLPIFGMQCWLAGFLFKQITESITQSRERQ